MNDRSALNEHPFILNDDRPELNGDQAVLIDYPFNLNDNQAELNDDQNN
ncbi:MAG: hypothetical protein WCJ03_00205 [Bacteroidales bacterium]